MNLRHLRPRPPASSAEPSRTAGAAGRERGQALVEFAAVLLPILLIIVGIIQFGMIFSANVTLTNATSEAARAATVARYDIAASRADNDIDRCTATLDSALQSFGLLNASSPNFVVTRPCLPGSASDLNGDGFDDRWVNGDLTLSLCTDVATPTAPCPTTGTYCTLDEPVGCLVQVTLTYRSDIVVPLVGVLLPTDGSGRFIQSVTTTMKVN